MARFIVENKLYNTETATLLCEGKRRWKEYSLIFGREMYFSKDTRLYKTKKGAFFFVSELEYEQRMQVCTEDEAKKFLMYNNLDKYEELYGKLEEA